MKRSQCEISHQQSFKYVFLSNSKVRGAARGKSGQHCRESLLPTPAVLPLIVLCTDAPEVHAFKFLPFMRNVKRVNRCHEPMKDFRQWTVMLRLQMHGGGLAVRPGGG